MSGRSIIYRALALFAALALALCALPEVSALAYAAGEVIGDLPEPLYATKGSELDSLRDSTIMSSPLGEATADAAALAAGADFGYVCGGDMWGNLAEGPLTWDALANAYTEDRLLAVAEVTPATLKNLLEAAAGALAEDAATKLIDREASHAYAFPQLSGLRVRIDMSAPAGERIRSIRIVGGDEMDLSDNETAYTLAATDFMLSGGYGMPETAHETLDVTMAEAMAEYVRSGIEVSYTAYSRAERVVLEGGAENKLYDYVPRGTILVVIALALVCQLYRRRTRRDQNDRTVDW